MADLKSGIAFGDLPEVAAIAANAVMEY